MRSLDSVPLAAPAIVAAVAGLFASLPAQSPVLLRPSASASSATAVAPKLAPTPANAAPAEQDPARPANPAEAQAQAAADQRLQKWKQLLFDRRPSSVLAAWAAPELKPYDPAEEAAKAAAAAGKPQPAPAPAAAPAGTAALSPQQVQEVLARDFGVPIPGQPAPLTEAQLAEKRLQREYEMFQRDVTLGRWDKVGGFFTALAEKDRKDCYEHFLRVLPNHPQTPADQRVPPQLQEKNRFAFEDVFALAALAPGGFDKAQVPLLAPLVRRATEGGAVVEEFLRLLQVEVQRPPAEQRLDRREAALLCAAIGQEVELAAFLPSAAEAEQANDREALNLLARHALAMFQKEQKNVWLETAWRVTQAVLAKGEVAEADKAEALRRAVELAPKVRQELGPAWLAESFTARPERGMEILAAIGGQVAKGAQDRAQDAAYRSQGLQLQKTAVEALLREAPALAAQWQATLGLLASGWIVEASWSYATSQSDSMYPVMQRDDYGNIFWSQMRRGGSGQVAPIEPADLIESQPGPEWAARLDPALQPHFATVSAQLFLKVNEPARAFPFIEQLAKVNPRKGRELADEFLRVWTRANDPNARNNYTNQYMFMYGFDQRASGIPLTRSKQERNLADLSSWVERLRQLPIGGVDEKLLSQAFVAAHSKAEVYRLETIEKVFGDVAQLDPVLLGELLSTMRRNLATVWRRPDVQEQNKTKRSQRETLEEVGRGYATALEIARQALTERGEHWALLSVTAAILHDQNNFSRELARDSNFAEIRKGAFALFAQAAAHYRGVVETLRLDQESLTPYDAWFYAALGASDLGAVDEETVVAKSQLPLIRAALEGLPGAARERHLAQFANALFTRMSAVKPQIKFRYLEAGFEVVGDHPRAAEAKKVFDYYLDLTRELRLEAVVEGPAEVATQPFGLRVDIVHSPEIERESGGFAKYAQNQNNQGYAYNYGRPLENYRDRFQEAATAALREHFEVLSVTFNSEGMQSKPTDQAGWRRTPYAWLLLKAKGPQIDRIPPLQVDFDFLDTSGYMVLPVGSAAVPVDASRAPAEPRPCRDLAVTQTLDERRADEGKIVLEIKATATGLVPDLEALLQLDLPGFQVQKRDDQGASVVKFAEDQDSVQSERVWLLSLVADGEAAPRSFVFGKPRREDIKAVYQRYADADLQMVAPEIALGTHLGSGVPLWLWIVLGAAFVAYGIWFLAAPPGGRATAPAGPGLELPRRITPFTVLEFLHEVARRPLDAAAREQLQQAIGRIEACHFGRQADPDLDLPALAREWLQRVR